MRTKILVYLLLLFPAFAQAQKKSPFLPEKINLDWKLVSNNHEGKDQYLATLRISNTNPKAPLPASGWTIYFNALRDMAQKDVGEGLMMEHIHGDLFRLWPTAAFKGIEPGKSITLHCLSNDWAFNRSDAPCGFYWVWDNAPETSYNITSLTIAQPEDINKFNRFPGQKNDQITPEMVFEQNKNIENIPLASLPLIFPTPQSCVKGTGSFEISPQTVIIANTTFAKEAAFLAESLSKLTGTALTIQKNASKNAIQFLDDAQQSSPEGYRLNVTSTGVEIHAKSPAGAFYAIQSLLQLIPADAWKTPASRLQLPAITVKDAPRYEYRGLHLDIGRNFQNKVEIMRVLNWMAMYKLNKFHFHFTEDEAWRLEIPGLPELTTVGVQRGHTLDSKAHMPATYGSGGSLSPIQSSFLSRQEYIELLKYAQSLHIQVIPEIETPGHARAAIKAMDARYRRLMAEGKPTEAEEYLLSDPNDQSVYRSAQNFTDNVMCVARPSVYHFIEKVVDELMRMHQEAGVPLETVHLGGDEVPRGVWERSPLCQDLLKKLPNDKYRQTSDLWVYYWEKLRDMMNRKKLYISGWEEIGMRETKIDGNKTMIVNPTFANDNFHTYVWNTVVGWGTEDLPYRLANGGYKVVLCPVSNLYFDLAYMKDFDEPGYYWGGFLDVDKPFYFIPNDYLKNAKVDRFGNPIDPEVLRGKDRLTDYGKTNIVGIQGHLWSENMRSAADLEYLALPKMLGLCERAWAPDPAWATSTNEKESTALYQKAWSEFVNVLGKKELPRLCWYQGGAGFRIPTVGAKVENGAVLANIQLPGFTIRYTTDGSEPSASSTEYNSPVTAKGQIKLRAFDARGRGGRSVVVNDSN